MGTGGPGRPPGGKGGRGPGEKGPPPREGQDDASPQARLLQPGFDFAAPLVRGLLLQRTRHSVIFASQDGSRQVLVPLDDEVELDGGVRARAQVLADGIALHLETADGFQADYRYQPDPEAAGGLRVEVSARGRDDAAPFEVRRRYRPAG